MNPRKSMLLMATYLFSFVQAGAFAFAVPPKTQAILSIEKAIAKIRPSVVYIQTMLPCEHDGLHRYDKGSGTGVIVKLSGDTYILTNNHVVQGAGVVEIRLNDNEQKYMRAVVLGNSREKDLSVLKVHLKGSVAGKRPAVIASVPAPVGTQVVKAGYPGAVDSDQPSFAAGIVSNTNAYCDRFTIPYGVTDAQISRGDSGGPLFNLKGEVVGINARLSITEVTIGHYIPADVITAVIPKLFNGDERKGWLGLALDQLVLLQHVAGGKYRYGEMHGIDYHIIYSESSRVIDIQTYNYASTPFGDVMILKEAYALPLMSLERGILVIDVSSWANYQSPFHRGDVIIVFNRRAPKDARELTRWIGETEPGSAIPVTMRRDGNLMEIMVTVDEFNWDWKEPKK